MFRALTLAALFLLTSSAFAEDLKPWPQKFQARPAKVIAVEALKGVAHAYETANFRLHSDNPIKEPQLTKFATVIESVPQLIRTLPLDLWAPPAEAKPRVVLCRDAQTYHRQGAPVGTTGYYSGRRQCVFIRADVFLNPPPSQPTRLQPKPNEDLLVHELTHLVMHGLLWRTSPWLYEGLAEYMSAAHIGGGAYNFSRIDSAIRDHIRLRHPPNANHQITCASLDYFLPMTGKQWIDANSLAENRAAHSAYAVSLLLTHYHLQSSERRKDIQSYLILARAHRDSRRPFPRMQIGSATEIEKRLAKFWHPKGLPIRFKKP
jgi:hypothetical protein